jgi:hypothetical protein
MLTGEGSAPLAAACQQPHLVYPRVAQYAFVDKGAHLR